MTAVEQFFKDLCDLGYIEWDDDSLVENRLNLALEMENEQIIDSYERGWDMGALDIDCNSEKYYSETYKKDNQ